MAQENPSGVHVWLILMKAHQAFQQHAERSIQATGLCFSDFGTMEILLHKGPQPINAIGERLGLTSGALTAAVDRLEKKGLVERCSVVQDRRVRIIHLTKRGKEEIEAIFAKHALDMEKAFAGLTVKEQETLVHLLKKAGKFASEKP